MPNSAYLKYIPVEECFDAWLYRIASRDLKLNVFQSTDRVFLGIRHETGARSLFAENHVDCGPPFGTATPFEKICRCPVKKVDEFVEERVNGKLEDNVNLLKGLTSSVDFLA